MSGALAATRTFDLPAGDAANTLKMFSDQSGEQVIFLVEQVRGVRTNPVSGERETRAALDAMLANTGLVAVEDSTSGALAVRRATNAAANPPTTAAPASGNAASPATTAPRLTAAAPRVAGGAESSNVETEIVLLSPFEVDSSRDQGYRATSTLAGSRINTDLKNVPSAISVVTAEFLHDVAAADVNDVLSYMVGAEGTGEYTAQEVQLGSYPSDNRAGNEQTANRVRGLAAADISRNYFYSIANGSQRGIGFDTYNLDTVTISRGPNAILFGQGSAAGLINYSPMRANVNQNSGELTFRIGSFDDYRATLNANHVLKKDVLGVRFAALWGDREFQQKPSFSEDHRYYAAVEYKPASKTTIRANYEFVDRQARTPNAFTPSDLVTPWQLAGSPTVDLSTAPAAADSNAWVIYNSRGVLETVYYGMFLANLQFMVTRPSGFREIGISSKRLLDYEKVNLRASIDEHRAHLWEVSLEQEFARNLFVNLEYFGEDYDFHREGASRSDLFALRVDNVTRLRNGQANPHFGELYINSHGLDFVRDRPARNDVYRATATYSHDFKEKINWLGRWTFTGFVEHRETKIRNDLLDENDTPRLDPNVPDYRIYLGGGANAQATGLVHPSGLANNAPALRWDAATSTWTSTSYTTQFVPKRLEETIDRLNSRALVAQAFLFDERVVATAGLRRDENKSRNRQALGTAALPDDYNVADPIAQTTSSYGVMVHPMPWLSLFYNKSENFVPKAGVVDLFENPTPFPEGEGEDYGFALHLLEGKLDVKVNWFEVASVNDFPGEVARILAQWQLPAVEYGFIGPTVENAPQFAGITYEYFNPNFSGDLSNPGVPIWGDGRMEFGSYTADTTAHGVELELTYNITPSWRLMANATKQEARRSNIARGLIDLVQERFDYWASIPGLMQADTTPYNIWGSQATVEQIINQQLIGPFFNIQAADGKPAPDLNKYRFNVITNYTIREGTFSGVNFGGGLRWADSPIIGTPYLYNAQGQITAADLEHPYRGDSDFDVDLWIGYTRKLNERYTLGFQFNIRNVTEEGGVEVIDAAGPLPGTGQRIDQTFGIVQPRTYYLTTKLSF